MKESASDMSIIQVKNLSKKYEFYRKEPGLRGTIKALVKRDIQFAQAVKDISFTINKGDLVGFLGPNGAGKTTTLKMLSGIIPPTNGSIQVMNYKPIERKKEYQKKFALIMGQKNQLILDLPARESFELRKVIYEIPEKEYIKNIGELITLLDVNSYLDIPVRKLSLGQRMKCELIAALLHKPQVLFLDEPTIGLDVIAQKNIRDFIKKYNQKEKTTIILTSHYMEDIRLLCKRVIIINLGTIIYDGDLDTLIKKYATHKSLKVTFSTPLKADKELRSFGEITELSEYEIIWKVPVEKAKTTAAKILSSNLPVEDIVINDDNIDEVIREIFKN